MIKDLKFKAFKKINLRKLVIQTISFVFVLNSLKLSAECLKMRVPTLPNQLQFSQTNICNIHICWMIDKVQIFDKKIGTQNFAHKISLW